MRVCFQCRYTWLAKAPAVGTPAREAVVESQAGYAFTPDDVARLGIYRLAVQAGFFSDAR
jgi:hypothetical protein